MEVLIEKNSEAVYKTGFLNYALKSLEAQGGFKEYAEWLEKEPVMSFVATEGWSIDPKTDSIVYKDEEGSMQYDVTMLIMFDLENIVHCASMPSWFFRVIDDKVEALYVD